jgi:hypothetical protein
LTPPDAWSDPLSIFRRDSDPIQMQEPAVGMDTAEALPEMADTERKVLASGMVSLAG